MPRVRRPLGGFDGDLRDLQAREPRTGPVVAQNRQVRDREIGDERVECNKPGLGAGRAQGVSVGRGDREIIFGKCENLASRSDEIPESRPSSESRRMKGFLARCPRP